MNVDTDPDVAVTGSADGRGRISPSAPSSRRSRANPLSTGAGIGRFVDSGGFASAVVTVRRLANMNPISTGGCVETPAGLR